MNPTLIQSANLHDEVWIVEGQRQADDIRAEGDRRPIYLRRELPHLKDMTPEEQRTVHAYKKAFNGEIIETRPPGPDPSIKKFEMPPRKQDNRQHGQTRREKSAPERGDDADSGGTLRLSSEF